MSEDAKVTKFTLLNSWLPDGKGGLILVGPMVFEQDGEQVFPEPKERNPQCRCAWRPER